MKKNLKDWREVYYPIAADEATGSDIEAIKHSIRKWKGLEEEVLERFGVELWRSPEKTFLKCSGSSTFDLGSKTCALCARHPDCTWCPLYISLGEDCFSDVDSLFEVFRRTGNPEKMIKALEKVLNRLETVSGDEDENRRKSFDI